LTSDGQNGVTDILRLDLAESGSTVESVGASICTASTLVPVETKVPVHICMRRNYNNEHSPILFLNCRIQIYLCRCKGRRQFQHLVCGSCATSDPAKNEMSYSYILLVTSMTYPVCVMSKLVTIWVDDGHDVPNNE
jgi:hypothetical protein